MAANVMLAGKFDPKKARFPYLGSSKLDGVRAIIRGGVVLSRNLEPIPNKHVQRKFGIAGLDDLDGELIAGNAHSATTFGNTMSGVTKREGEPSVTFNVFDRIRTDGCPFDIRLASATRVVREEGVPDVHILHHTKIYTQEDLDQFEESNVDTGYEGVMVRDPAGPYKMGRSTVNENYLLKVVQFETAEAEIIGYAEEMHNANEKVTNERGVVKRQSLRANMHGKGILGKLLVRDLTTGVEFGVGSGLTLRQKTVLWPRAKSLKGLIITYKFKPAGMKDKPRFPVFKGFRSKIDL